MKKQLSPPMIIGIVVAVVVLIALIAYKTVLAPPATVSGIGPNGQPMTSDQVAAMKNKMMGGARPGAH